METVKAARIFLVDDDLVFAKFLTRALEGQGYEVQAFSSGEAMISTWEEDPDIILLDYYIESDLGVAMNGEKTLRFIRRISKSLPVIALTATPDIGRATGMLKLGAIDFIVKDKEVIPNLDKTIRQALEARRLRVELAENRARMKKYRQRFLVIALVVSLAVMTLLWLYS